MSTIIASRTSTGLSAYVSSRMNGQGFEMGTQDQKTGLIKTISTLPAEDKFPGIALILLDGSLGVLAARSSGTQQVLLILAVILVFLVVVILVFLMRMDRRRRTDAQKVPDSLTGRNKSAARRSCNQKRRPSTRRKRGRRGT